MSSKSEWVEVNRHLELQDENGHVFESEVEHDGLCVHFDLSERKKNLKNAVRQFMGLKPIYPPRVISTTYRNTEMGKTRERVAQYIQDVDKQKIDSPSKKAIKRDLLLAFRDRFPRTRGE